MKNRTLWALLLVVGLTVMAEATAWAAGSEYQAHQEDLAIVVDARWAGCTHGGYYPIRIRVTNRAETRDLRISFEADNKGLPNVSRTVSVPQNATVTTSLLVPMVGALSYGNLNFSLRGYKLKEVSRHLALAEPDYQHGRPALLAITTENLDCSQFEVMVNSIMGTMAHSHWGGSRTNENHVVLPPTLLPQTSLGYSGLDVVAVPRATFEQLRGEHRDALLQWTQTGGVLWIYNVGEAVDTSTEFAKLTGLSRSAARTPWIKPKLENRVAISITETDQNGATSTHSVSNPEFLWKNADTAIAAKRSGNGWIVGFVGNPFPGTPHEWAWLVRSLSLDKEMRFANRHGLNARTENNDFFQFLIPGITSVPVYSFLIFITLFAFVIGPLNYYLLLKRHKLNWLVVTVPVLAVVTSVCLFAYSAVAHGFKVKARVRSMTVLDQGTQSAVTTSRLALYAGMAPSSGLKFSPETAVYPIWPTGQEFETGSIDWSDTQHMTSGWLRSRTKTQFITVAPRAERGRINVEAPSGGSLRVTNGLEWSLSMLAVLDDNGNAFFGQNIAAGAPATLTAMNEESRKTLLEGLRRSHPEFSGLIDGRDLTMFNGWSNSHKYRYGYYGATSSYHLSESFSERTLMSLINSQLREGSLPLTPRSYVALTSESPGVEFGTEVEVVDGWHVILGDY